MARPDGDVHSQDAMSGESFAASVLRGREKPMENGFFVDPFSLSFSVAGMVLLVSGELDQSHNAAAWKSDLRIPVLSRW
jgi:hypothetical protein